MALGSNLPPLLAAGSPSQITVTIDDDDSPTAPRERPFPLPIMRGDGALTLNWHMRPDHSPYTGYDVEYKVEGTGTPTTGWSDAGHTGTERRHVITGLTNGTTYETRIRARTDGGAGPWSRTVAQGQSADTVEGTPVAPPAAPTGLSVSPGRGYLAASWTAPSGEVTAYHLRFRETGSSTWWKWRSSRNDAWVSIYKTSATILSSKLTEGVAHDVQVRAFIEDSVGPWSATAQGTPE